MTNSGESVCRRCGSPVPAIEALGVTLNLPYCPPCGDLLAAEDEAKDLGDALGVAVRLAGGGGRLLEWSLDSYPGDEQGTAALEAAHAWIEGWRAGERANLWLHGPGGTGKTGLAWSLVRSLAENAVRAYYSLSKYERPAAVPSPALFLVWPDLLNELKGQFRMEQEVERGGDFSPSALLDRAGRVPVLALDELGGERPTPYALEQLAALVDRRYLARLPMIVTSNYSTRELAARLGREEAIVGTRIVSRLVDGAVGFKFEGSSRRRAASVEGRG